MLAGLSRKLAPAKPGRTFFGAPQWLQLFLFGYAINSNPKNLPAGLLSVEHSKYEHTLIAALRNTGYYDVSVLSSEAEAGKWLQ